MIFFLVEYRCFNREGAEHVLLALTKAATYQVDKHVTGVLTYHFSRPSARDPEALRFIEFYANETAFWEHAMDPTVSKALAITFDPAIRRSATWYAIYTRDVDVQVKRTVSALNGIEVPPAYVHLDIDSCKLPGKEHLFLVCSARNGQARLAAFLEEFGTRFSRAATYQIDFVDPVGRFHVVSLWPDQHAMLASLEGLELPAVEASCQVYTGAGLPSVGIEEIKRIFDPWRPTYHAFPEVGYSFHPGCT